MKRTLLTLLVILSTAVASAQQAPVIWNGSYAKFLPQTGLKLADLKEFRSLTVDPTAGAGVAAPVGSIGVRANAGAGEGWFKVGAADTAWTNFLTGGSGWSLLGNAGTNAAANYLGTSDAVDLVLRTNATERFRITSTGGYDTTLGTGLVHSDASGILTSSLLVNADVAAAGTANIARDKLASGTADHVVINSGAGVMTSEAQLAPLRGGTGVNGSAAANGTLLIGNGTGYTLATLTDGAGISITEAAGSITVASTITQYTDEMAQDTVGGALTDTASIDFTYNDAGNAISAAVLPAGVDHGGLGGLTDDDHTQYLLLAGRAGGQTATGGTAASNNLVLRSTSNGTKGQVHLDETTASTSATTGALRVDGGVGVGGAVNAAGLVRSGTSLVLEDPGAGTNTVTIQAGVVSGSHSLTLPLAQGAANSVLTNDGSGVLSWTVNNATPQVFGTRQTGRSVVAGTGITSGASHMSTTAARQLVFIASSTGSPNTITANPAIEAGTIVGQSLRLCGTSDTASVQIDNGNGISSNGSREFGKDDCCEYAWLGSDGTTSDWVEQSCNF
jgi:hypothetical protein